MGPELNTDWRTVLGIFKLRIGFLIMVTALAGLAVVPGGSAGVVQAVVVAAGEYGGFTLKSGVTIEGAGGGLHFTPFTVDHGGIPSLGFRIAEAEGGKALVVGAHQEAKAAMKEIRDLVRGIHPVILEDRGLDAALSAVVARAPIPVSLSVEVPERLPTTVESTAYFVVNEALTNISRHASATRASVAVVRAGDRLVVEVRDDGVGGADASKGTGLQGLRDRVSGVGGTMHVVSPEGGPTTISVEVPCAS